MIFTDIQSSKWGAEENMLLVLCPTLVTIFITNLNKMQFRKKSSRMQIQFGEGFVVF